LFLYGMARAESVEEDGVILDRNLSCGTL